MIKKKILYKILSAALTTMIMTSMFDFTLVKAESKSFIEKVASFSTGSSSEDGGAAEIVKYNKDNNKFYVINGIMSQIHIVTLDNASGTLNEDSIINVKSFVEKDGFVYGDITSISINNERKEIAVSVQEQDYTKDGKIVIVDDDGNLKAIYECGVQPDMITYTPDSKYILTAIREVYEESGLEVQLYNRDNELNLGRVIQLHSPMHTLLENVGHEVENIDFIYFARALIDKVNPQKGESKELFWFTKEEIEDNDTIKPHVKAMALDALRILKE